MEDRSPAAILSIEDAFYEARMFKAFGADQYPQSVSIEGRFELLERIGKGSYGTVFLAQDHQLERKVAVKVMPLGDPQVAEREGKLLAQLRHPNIVRIHDHGMKDDYRWLVLELLEGPTLGEWCQGKSPRAILERYLEAGRGLDAAHRQGMAHRDFKPGNVRLDDQGKAVVLDFGLARSLESLHGEGGSPDQVYGTFAYLPPEALRGQRAGEKGDQFSFCVSLWEALSGCNPFSLVEADLPGRLRALEASPRGGQRIPRRVRRVLQRGLAPLPGERWMTMDSLLEALDRANKVRRWPWGWAGLLLLIVAGLSPALARQRSQSVPTAVEVASPLTPDTDPVAVARQALEDGKVDEAFDALWAGYARAHDGWQTREFVDTAVLVAPKLEAQGHLQDAKDAWWMVLQLSLKLGDEVQAKNADRELERIFGRL